MIQKRQIQKRILILATKKTRHQPRDLRPAAETIPYPHQSIDFPRQLAHGKMRIYTLQGSPPQMYFHHGEATTTHPTTPYSQPNSGHKFPTRPHNPLLYQERMGGDTARSTIPRSFAYTNISDLSEGAPIGIRHVLFYILPGTTLKQTLPGTCNAESTTRDRGNVHPTISYQVGQSMRAQPANSMSSVYTNPSSIYKFGPKPQRSYAPQHGWNCNTETPRQPPISTGNRHTKQPKWFSRR